MNLKELSGIPVYKGMEIAPAFVYQAQEFKIERTGINAEQIEEELLRFRSVHQKVKEELKVLKEKAKVRQSREEIEILEAHLLMADDSMLIRKIQERIKGPLLSLEQAVTVTKQELMKIFSEMEDEYLQARAVDVEDVSDRFIRTALGNKMEGFEEIREDVILVAKDLKPSECSALTGYIKGILLEEGNRTSHAAIMAKAKGIPAIVGISGLLDSVRPGNPLILDSVGNKIIVFPTDELCLSYQEQKKNLIIKKQKLEMLKEKAAVTKDGKLIKLYGNIGTASEAAYVKECGGRGIGLFRSEFLYMNAGNFPAEEEQFREYKKTAEQGFEEVIIRTLDIGGDKNLPYYQFKKENNPFLGFRALRYMLANTDLFKTQLRAVLRASAYGKISIMFPMVSSLEEVQQAKAILESCKAELKNEQIAYDPDIKTGIMIEIPSAAVIADILIKEVDFFSIGTNDLCQYTLAADRMNKEVSYLYQPLHPGILRLMKQTADAARAAGKETAICGEMAGETLNTMLLIGMGIEELSMSPAVIPQIKNVVRQIEYKKAKILADCVLQCRTSQEVKAVLENEAERSGHE